MTLIEERPGLIPGSGSGVSGPSAPVPGEDEDAPVTAEAAVENGAGTLMRSLVVLLLIAVIITALWKGFNQVVTPAWYRTHQHHLAADFNKQRAGLQTGQAAGVLQIPGIGANLMLVEGTSTDNLRGGPGHRPGTPLPGSKGNSIIEGHRDRWGAPFADLDQLVKRTRIVAEDRSQIGVEYRVTTVKTVKRSQLAKYLAPSKDYRITLVTQAGGAFSDDRLVIQAVAGTPSKQAGSGKVPALDPQTSSAAPAVLAFVLAAAAAVVLGIRLRRDHGIASVLIVVVPLGIAAVLALLLLVDGTLPPLL